MGNLLKDGSDWLQKQRNAHMTSSIKYRRGDLSVDLLATIGRSTFEVMNQYNIAETVVTRDYLILASTLILAGQISLPQRGDTIEEVDDSGSVFIYEVISPGGAPEYSYSDSFRKTLRIHSKQIQSEQNRG